MQVSGCPRRNYISREGMPRLPVPAPLPFSLSSSLPAVPSAPPSPPPSPPWAAPPGSASASASGHRFASIIFLYGLSRPPQMFHRTDSRTWPYGVLMILGRLDSSHFRTVSTMSFHTLALWFGWCFHEIICYVFNGICNVFKHSHHNFSEFCINFLSNRTVQ